MTCREMQSVLPGLAEREGTPRVALDAARHLASCVSCAETLLRLRAMSGLLDRLPKAEVPAGFARRVLRALPVKGSAVTVLPLLMIAACWGAATSLGVSLAWLSSALSETFDSASTTLAIVARVAVGLLSLLRSAAGAWEPSPSSMFALSPLPQSHVLGLLIFAAVAFTMSGGALTRSRFARGPGRKSARQPIS